MASGVALASEERPPWLASAGAALCGLSGTVSAGWCALKRSYRDIIRKAAGDGVCFAHLAGSRQLIESCMAVRQGHFMPVSLLDSQFAALEAPGPGETAITITVDTGGDLMPILQRIDDQVELQS